MTELSNVSYEDLITFAQHGNPSSPRGLPTHERLGVTLRFTNPAWEVPFSTGRRMSVPLGYVEAFQLLAGVSSIDQLNAASGGAFDQYADQGRLLGAYGPRLFTQLPTVLSRLEYDPDTRQAHCNIWNSYDSTYGDSERPRDMPCTISIGFAIRDTRLHMFTHMRSEDVWRGWPYDIWMFSTLHRAMAWALKIEMGSLIHTVDNFHLYVSDHPSIQWVSQQSTPRQPLLPVPDLSAYDDLDLSASARFFQLRIHIRNILFGISPFKDGSSTIPTLDPNLYWIRDDRYIVKPVQ